MAGDPRTNGPPDYADPIVLRLRFVPRPRPRPVMPQALMARPGTFHQPSYAEIADTLQRLGVLSPGPARAAPAQVTQTSRVPGIGTAQAQDALLKDEVVRGAKTNSSPRVLAQAPLLLFEEPPALLRPPFEEYPSDPAKPPGPGWEWRGRAGSPPGGKDGAWFNPKTGESLSPDLEHDEPLGPHYDYRAPGKKEFYRWFPDGRFELSA